MAAPAVAAERLSLEDWLAALAKLDYNADDFRKGISDGTVSTLYVQLANERKALLKLQTLVEKKQPVAAAVDNVDRNLSLIRKFYGDYIRQPWLGDESAYRSPDVIVILGANRPALEPRLAHALPLIQRFKDIPVVLSGGGRGIVLEAQIMRDYLVDHGVAEDRLIMEPDSLDTVGNAVFSGLVMMKKGIRGGKVLLVTSDFHAPRALFLFRSILGSGFQAAVSSSPSTRAVLPARIEDEFQDQALTIQDLLHWPSISGQPLLPVKGPCDVFYQLLTRHKLYEFRWDLARRYADQCKL